MKGFLDIFGLLILAGVGVAVILHAGPVAGLVTAGFSGVNNLEKTLTTQ